MKDYFVAGEVVPIFAAAGPLWEIRFGIRTEESEHICTVRGTRLQAEGACLRLNRRLRREEDKVE